MSHFGVLFLCFISVVFVTTVNGTPRLMPHTPLNQTCVQLGANYKCEFWDCLERRFPCHQFVFKRAMGDCKMFDLKRFMFNEGGKQFLDASRKCLMDQFHEIYRRSDVSCDEVSEFGYNTISHCSLVSRPNICQVFWPNRHHFTQGFQVDFQEMQRIMRVFMKCGSVTSLQAIGHLMSTLGSSVRS
ncbi:uncharacterized protein LOC141912509 [Tubulanus polymorphus]|uniref:uncharacterized protein LOC141912509 n=1 Tax=Tubulanus polymorphus TaxID=672921 RepID=UPI003DA60A25